MNLFRFNCLIEDRNHDRLNSIILSLIFEKIFENYNDSISRNDCFRFLVEDFKFQIEKDYFFKLIDQCDSLIKNPNVDDVLINLKPEKFDEIKKSVNEESLESYIKKFVNENLYNEKMVDIISNLLYEAIYNNISSFNTNNIKSIIPKELKTKYSNEEIEAFNNFIDWDNYFKNLSVFNIFQMAVEFSIFTSSFAIKELSKDIFVGKRYCLDANIIFRLLGIGGKDRKESLLNVIK